VVVMNQGRIEQTGSPAEVFDHPANAFVMDFLGNVNVFHGRLEQGKAVVPGIEFSFPEYQNTEARDAAIYVRPHELWIERQKNGVPSLEAKVLHISPTGSRTKVELRAVNNDALMTAELTAERFAELSLKSGETVHVSARRVRVFGLEAPPQPEYSI
jgi:sulfate transport system ATP-binding protein